jgi:hypothetical protein
LVPGPEFPAGRPAEQQAINVNHAVRQIPPEAAPAQSHRAPSNVTASATIIPLSAASGGASSPSAGKPAGAPNPPPGRRRSRSSDLIFGGTLALILLIACLTWEVLSHEREALHGTAEGSERAFTPASR